MSIKIHCDISGHEDNWLEFREEGWTVGDRIRFNRARDLEALKLILQWTEDWHLTDADGNEIERGDTIDCFDRVPMRLWPWLLGAVLKAFTRACVLPKN